MNGPVSTVKLGRPMTWEEFSGMPESLRRQYIQDILNHYDVGPNAIGRMLGVSGPYCGKRLRELGFKFETRASVKETERFLPPNWRNPKNPNYAERVCCKDCEWLVFSDCYGECGKGVRGIVRPDDTCCYGVRRRGHGLRG